MPIKVQCACGKAFAAKDELAGKTVKCPSCQQPLKIAAGGNNKPAAPKPAAKPSPAKAAAPAPSAGSPPIDDLFDDIGLAPPEEGTRPCPGCSQSMPIEAVICIKCGYNTRIGRRMTTEVVGGGSEVGHGAVAQDLLDKAANEIEGDEEAEEKKTTEGMPWWVYLIILIILVTIATVMLMRSESGEEESDEPKAFLAPVKTKLV